MPLEKLDTIDMVLKPKDDQIVLVITDAGVTTDPGERYDLLLKKLGSYVNYAFSADFAQTYPGITPDKVIIRVICATPPTEMMQQIFNVGKRSERPERITVEFEVWNPSERS